MKPNNNHHINHKTKTKTKTKTTNGPCLGSFLKYFHGMDMVVELKTGRRIHGILESVDDAMNMTLENVRPWSATTTSTTTTTTTTTSNNNSSTNSQRWRGDELPTALPLPSTRNHDDVSIPMIVTSSMHIRGPTIRYIHFPDHVDLSLLVRTGMEREKAATNKYRRGQRK